MITTIVSSSLLKSLNLCQNLDYEDKELEYTLGPQNTFCILRLGHILGNKTK